MIACPGTLVQDGAGGSRGLTGSGCREPPLHGKVDLLTSDPISSEGQPLLAASDFGSVLNGFISRAGDMMHSHLRMRALLIAVVTIAEDLSLEAVLDRVIRSACELVGARYGALGIIGDDQRLTHFITVGIDDDAAAKIGPLPTGHGVLGLLIREPRPLRLKDLREHPQAYGFPANHPPMQSFLGVPIRVRDTVFGNLYLTEKTGGGEFTVEDEELLVALASAAGVAVENARLFRDARVRQDWLEACMRVSALTMSSAEDAVSVVSEGITDAIRAVADSRLAAVVFPATDGTRMYCATARGEGAAELVGRVLPVNPAVLTEVLRTGVPAVVADSAQLLAVGDGAGPGGILLLIPLGPSGPDQGLLALVRDHTGEPFTETEVQMSAVFGAHVALALELARTRRTREDLKVFTERDRIARDLHDVVIQRLFAAGLSMQSLRRFTTEPVAQERIAAVTDELDQSIRELRATIYALQGSRGDRELLSSRILREVMDRSKSIAFSPRLRFTGEIDSAVPPDVAEHLIAVISEGLSNAVRHSGADAIEIDVSARAHRLELVIVDNGHGIGNPVNRSGLANLERRAQLVGGALEIADGPEGGTRLRLVVPIGE